MLVGTFLRSVQYQVQYNTQKFTGHTKFSENKNKNEKTTRCSRRTCMNELAASCTDEPESRADCMLRQIDVLEDVCNQLADEVFALVGLGCRGPLH